MSDGAEEFDRVQGAESVLKRPLPTLGLILREVAAHRHMARALAVRDLKARHRQSLLGVLWYFLPPIAAGLGLMVAQQARVISFGQTSIPYPAYVMLSVALWQSFTLALNAPLTGLSRTRSLLTKVSFPREVVVLAEFYKMGFGLLVQVALIAGVFAVFQVKVSGMLVLAPVAWAMLILFGLGLGLFLGPVAMLYSDITHALPMVTGLWFMLTPVIYPPPQTQGWFARVVQWNPVSPLLETARELATNGVILQPVAWVAACGLAVALTVGGLLFFRAAMPIVVERWSA